VTPLHLHPLTGIEQLFRLLNMRSSPPATPDDRTTRARIRDAAIQVVADHGTTETTARRVAAAADVSPGSVIHHFGSMEDLRRACDEHVAATIRERKQAAIAQGPSMDLLGTIRTTQDELLPLLAYLAQVLTEDSDAVADLVDEMVRDAADYLREGIANGMIRPTDDVDGQATIMTIWSLGGLVMHRHVRRLLGADLTGRDDTAGEFTDYAAAAYGVLGEGMFTPEFAETARTAFARAQAEREAPPATGTARTDTLEQGETA
jgi:AcrR family transcriptional regulator